MRKVVHNIKITHIMADGRVLTNEEFMSKPFVVDFVKNKEWYQEVARTYDPMYSKREIAKMEVERTQRRKAELEKEFQKISMELAEM